jgi:hypothetical protein
MTAASVSRIEGQLEARFAGLIDVSDVSNHPQEHKRNVFLSRALAALCIKALAKTDAAVAAKAVTDAFTDNGLDAIHYDQNLDVLLLVQSKWSNDGTSTLDSKATLSMAQGVRDLLQARFDKFNNKVKAKEAEIRGALYSGRTKIVLVTAHTALQETAPHVRRNVDELVEDLNKAIVQAESQHFNQAGVYRLIAAESGPEKITLPISLREWGQIQKPFLGFYGRVHANEISRWWTQHGNDLFTQNLRFLYLRSEVNDALNQTLAENPEFFWYFNNGITVICDNVDKAMAGSPGREIGLFTCHGANIVNGAQTVGTIGGSWKAEEQQTAGDAWVQVRIISLQNCPPEFSKSITRATNHQNVVGNREFAAMDSNQHRLATEFVLDRRRYAYRQGELKPHGSEGCDIDEATVALACDSSVALAVQAKKELGALWANTSGAPYIEIFNAKTTSSRVWRLVQIMRAVDEELHKLRSSDAPRADLIGIHLNRVILHIVMKDPQLRPLRHEEAPESECVTKAREITSGVFAKVTAFMEKNHRDEYPAAVSKNVSRCERLVRNLQGEPKEQATAGDWEAQSLFKDPEERR